MDLSKKPYGDNYDSGEDGKQPLDLLAAPSGTIYRPRKKPSDCVLGLAPTRDGGAETETVAMGNGITQTGRQSGDGSDSSLSRAPATSEG